MAGTAGFTTGAASPDTAPGTLTLPHPVNPRGRLNTRRGSDASCLFRLDVEPAEVWMSEVLQAVMPDGTTLWVRVEGDNVGPVDTRFG